MPWEGEVKRDMKVNWKTNDQCMPNAERDACLCNSHFMQEFESPFIDREIICYYYHDCTQSSWHLSWALQVEAVVTSKLRAGFERSVREVRALHCKDDLSSRVWILVRRDRWRSRDSGVLQEQRDRELFCVWLSHIVMRCVYLMFWMPWLKRSLLII